MGTHENLLWVRSVPLTRLARLARLAVNPPLRTLRALAPARAGAIIPRTRARCAPLLTPRPRLPRLPPFSDVFVWPPPASAASGFTDLYLVSDLMETDLSRIIESPQPLSNSHLKCVRGRPRH